MIWKLLTQDNENEVCEIVEQNRPVIFAHKDEDGIYYRLDMFGASIGTLAKRGDIFFYVAPGLNEPCQKTVELSGLSDCIDNGLAFSLQEKGFKVDWEDDSTEEHPEPSCHSLNTFAEVLDWLRKEKGLLVYAYNYPKTSAYAVTVEYNYSIRSTEDAKRRDDSCKEGFASYEEAIASGIYEAIRLI